MPLYFIYITLGLLTSLVAFTLLHFYKLERQHDKLVQIESRWTDINRLLNQLHDSRISDQRSTAESKEQLLRELNSYRQQFDQHQIGSLKLLQDSLQQGLQHISQRMDKLTENTQEKLLSISGQVEKRLFDGFAQTTATFTDVVKRLALIDEAQKRITELSNNVVNLQHILADKRSRGVFGEVQLNALIENVLPKKNYSLQHTLSNGKRVDCLLLLPSPTGSIAIDAKFPLEGFRKLTDIDLPKSEQRAAATQFRQDIRHHIQAVASKYIIPGETSEGALLFIPAEAVFAEIHAHYYDLVEEAQRQRVWLVSPTTMMAVLTTSGAILKDAATREQIHLIQDHLNLLSKDFSRFKQRMDHLFRHIQQAYSDIQEAKTSADKITSRFEKIEKVELTSSTLECQ
ncbi:MAG: DNA recombination protein RmuC [Candidatus Aquirickettsiella gammari]|uniref:DNA recombination protein RmuC n=1 Tax=Candidatus Aquirickettsiella gammari TaxID=2016198 RepID=A0A370CIY1_9COXI|nr:MAG: DNA recombination protein RmuC [Candidatus Aquirickettsiella gammari]